MELRLHHIIDHLYNIFLENDGSENCAQLLEEEVNKMFSTHWCASVLYKRFLTPFRNGI